MSMDTTDHCSCFKEAGCFGYAGFHWLIFSEAWIERRCMERMPGMSDAQCQNYLKEGRDEDKRDIARHLLTSRQGFREQQRSYIGTEWAYERCQKWTDAYKANLARERADKQGETMATATGTRLRR